LKLILELFGVPVLPDYIKEGLKSQNQNADSVAKLPQEKWKEIYPRLCHLEREKDGHSFVDIQTEKTKQRRRKLDEATKAMG
jgi:hypothetical protein